MKEKLLIPIAVLFVIFASLSVHHQSIFHWVSHRASVANIVLQQLEERFPQELPKTIFIDDSPTLSSEDIYFSLVGSEGVRFWFDRQDINVEYARWQDEPSQEAVVVSFYR